MYARKHFTEEEMMIYEMIPNYKNKLLGQNYWILHQYIRHVEAYSEDWAAEIRFESAENITHIAPPASIKNASFDMNRGNTMGSIKTAKEYKTTAAHNEYIKGM